MYVSETLIHISIFFSRERETKTKEEMCIQLKAFVEAKKNSLFSLCCLNEKKNRDEKRKNTKNILT